MSTAAHLEERANAATHALGLLCSLAGAAIVLNAAVQRGGAWEVWGCAVYAVTLIAAYTFSTLSHAVSRPDLRRTFRVADQAVIFLFIAGTYTPIALAWLRARPWWILHVLIWGVAIIGFFSKAMLSHRVRLGTVSTTLYVILGWLPMTAFRPMAAAVPSGLMECLVAGGLCYMAGLIFFNFDHRIRYFHAAWHLLVLAGSSIHYLGILLYCTGRSQ